ncbi:MAG: nucleotide exchange factor GrpE [Coriobacteriales bacterium]|jgi:molecular chaperone GrpE|nr:nucleotide exchange factor GrpE [Coriobacteriales bacterium]
MVAKKKHEDGMDEAAAADKAAAAGEAAAADDSILADAAAIEDLARDFEAVESEIVAELTELDAVKAEAERLRDRYARLQAEWDNFRRRIATEREQERSRAAERLVEKLLPVLDDLERAVDHSDTVNGASLKEGITAVFSKFNEVLAKEGLEAIDPLGEAFDATVHQAVGTLEDTTVPDETVAQVYQKGYRMANRVLRPATVAVSSGGPKREASDRSDR